jgi:polyisoprenoid-binding protein YceI
LVVARRQKRKPLVTTTAEQLRAPPEGTYVIDPAKSIVTFVTTLAGLHKAPGTFTLLSGSIEVDGPSAIAVDVVLDATSFNTHNASRDKQSTSPEFLDTGRYPRITYQAAADNPGSAGMSVDGVLTVRAIAAPVPLAIQSAEFADGLLYLTALATIDRYAFGVAKRKGLVGRKLPATINLVARCSSWNEAGTERLRRHGQSAVGCLTEHPPERSNCVALNPRLVTTHPPTIPRSFTCPTTPFLTSHTTSVP